VTRRRLLAAAVGAGVLLTGLPVLAVEDRGGTDAELAESGALALLERAAVAGRRLTYAGTQYVATWREGGSDSALVELQHDPASGSVVTGADGPSQAAVATAVLDPRMLARLASSYSLSVRGPGRCTGREASVVEARRPDGHVAGRFWVDRSNGMLLRREVFDASGRRVRSSAFVDLDVRSGSTSASYVAVTARTGFERPAQEAVERLRGDGWLVPERLPGGFRLFETRRSGEVLHLAYTDGLSTLSLFAQDGELGSRRMDGFTVEQVGGRPVRVRRAAPERVVWAGGGRVWTLVSDAPEDVVLEAVAALPRDDEPDDGVRTRLGRGLARLGGMLNPFG
jgi:sigma-E factor negative regulatory protein RseB